MRVTTKNLREKLQWMRPKTERVFDIHITLAF